MRALILENIRSAYNVGAIFRTADGAGFDKIFLGGYTPRPVDRFGRVQPDIAKTSLGAAATVAWEAVDTVPDSIRRLQADQVRVIAVELTPTATTLAHFTPPPRVAYVLGSEVHGVSFETLALVDAVVSIPMRGAKESLNVSVAAGIIMYHDLVLRV
jgi:tRNA G18 (ribose-2'-O)-methylase SpoU